MGAAAEKKLIHSSRTLELHINHARYDPFQLH